MLEKIVHLTLLFLLALRYRIRVQGLRQILEKGNRSILFLPNHPALIDPVIVMSRLFHNFHPRPLADEEQVAKIFIRPLMKMIQAVVIPDIQKRGISGRKIVMDGIQRIVKGLQHGDNILLYPAGRIYRSRYESIGANSSVDLVLQRVPDVRVVLVRSTGLWGSSFSRANGIPSLTDNINFFLFALLSAGLFFMPKREVFLEFVEPLDFPRGAGKMRMNRFLEDFYNEASKHNSFVPYYWWQGSVAKNLPEPVQQIINDDTSHIPVAIKALVLEKLQSLSGVRGIQQEDKLAQDLGMDSLVLVEFMDWLEQEFGVTYASCEGLLNVAHCMLAAVGEFTLPEGLQ